jgi:drug/metabolite transporter (DMT)-like permease
VPRSQNLTLRLIWSLMHEPVWFGGVLAIIAGFLLQASALGSGQLATVEPILVAELPFTLILGSWVFRQRMGASEWWPTAVMTAGLAGLLYFLSPSSGRPGVRWYVWVTGIGANLIVIAIPVAMGRRGQNSRRAALLGVAAGAAFGMTAALIKGTTQVFERGGIGPLLTSWQLYAMVVSGMLGMFLTQSAMNAGRLVAAQPALTLTDPVVSILWGVLAFGEKVRDGWFGILAGICGVATAAGVVALAKSPLLSGAAQDSEQAEQSKAV